MGFVVSFFHSKLLELCESERKITTCEAEKLGLVACCLLFASSNVPQPSFFAEISRNRLRSPRAFGMARHLVLVDYDNLKCFFEF